MLLPQIRLCVTKMSVEVGRLDDVTCVQPWHLLWLTWLRHVGGNSSVGIATRFGLGCLGIEYRWEARFSTLFQNGFGASCTLGTGSVF